MFKAGGFDDCQSVRKNCFGLGFLSFFFSGVGGNKTALAAVAGFVSQAFFHRSGDKA